METVLEALPDQPLTAEDIATLNEAASIRLIPYTWYGEQVIAILLLHDRREQQNEIPIEDATGTETEGEKQTQEDAGGEDTSDTGFGTRRSSTVGTVELLEDDSLAPDQDEEPEEVPETDDGAGAESGELAEEEELKVYAVGYDDSAAGWVVISQIDPDAELTEAEPLIREWISDRYHDQIVDKLAVGPSEYDLDDSGE